MLQVILFSTATGCICLFLLSYISYDAMVEPMLGMWIGGIIAVHSTTFDARLAAFGPHPPLEGWPGPRLEGPLKHVLGDACHTLENGFNEGDVSGAIALVLRGNCTFVDKIMNLKSAGAIAVVVGNRPDIDNGRDFSMIGPLDRIDIPSMSVPALTFQRLIELEGEIATLWSRPQEYDLVTGLVLFVVRPLLLLAILSLILSINLYHDRAKRRASQRTIDEMPTFYWSNGACGERETRCAICLEDFDSHSLVMMLLPCRHVYHSSCVTRWLLSRRNICPICKRPVECETDPLLGREHSRQIPTT